MRLPNVLWYFVVLIALPFLLAVLIPAKKKVGAIARRAVCRTALEGLSTAMALYVNDNDDTLPIENWCDLMIEEVEVSYESFECPESDAIEGECPYAMNKHIAGLKLTDIPADVVLFFETDMGVENGPRDAPITSRRYIEFLKQSGHFPDGYTYKIYKDRFNQLGGAEDLVLRHEKGGRLGCNIVFADGHVEFVTKDRISDLKWSVE